MSIKCNSFFFPADEKTIRAMSNYRRLPVSILLVLGSYFEM